VSFLDFSVSDLVHVNALRLLFQVVPKSSDIGRFLYCEGLVHVLSTSAQKKLLLRFYSVILNFIRVLFWKRCGRALRCNILYRCIITLIKRLWYDISRDKLFSPSCKSAINYSLMPILWLLLYIGLWQILRFIWDIL
jgi:hypothetical protein